MSIFAKLSARRRLVTAFRLFSDQQPHIISVQLNRKNTRLIFTIPAGTDPAKITDHLYVFKQLFGANIELTGDHRRFILTVYNSSLPGKVPYKLADWQEAIAEMEMPIIVGMNRTGQPVAYDIATHPHLLLSGETGAGKSSLLRAVLTTLMLTKSPEQVRFVLGDMKRSEFGLFRNLPHVDGVHVEAEALEKALIGVKKEMNRRGDLLDKAEVTHISELPDRLPYIVVAIDEVALLRKEKHCMEIIEDISSTGRSLGCLLINAMQRPDAKLLDGRLKNNLTVRISGRQSNATNAKVAGTPGADEIKPTDKGRMVFLLDQPELVQSPWLAMDTAKKLLEPLKIKSSSKPPQLVEEAPEEAAPTFTFGMLGGDHNAIK